MENRKRGFVLYFDNSVVLDRLPPEQRGWVLSALCCYADRVWRDPSITMEEILELYPALSEPARLVCGMIGTAILRDTQRWLHQQEARNQRRAAPPPKRDGAGFLTRAAPPPEKSQEEQRKEMRDYVEGLKRTLAQMGGNPSQEGGNSPWNAELNTTPPRP